MEHQEAMLFLIMVALVLGIGNTYYIAKLLFRTRARTRFEDSGKAKENADKLRKMPTS